MTVPKTMCDARGGPIGQPDMTPASGPRLTPLAGPPPSVVTAGGVLTGRTFAALAFTRGATAPYRRRLVAAAGRRGAALRAFGVDITVISHDGSVPAGVPGGCRLARGDNGAEVMRGILAVLARRGVGPGLLLVVGTQFGAPGGEPGPDGLLLVPEAARAVAVSVGPEPDGVPTGVVHAGGGSGGLLALLDEQVRRHARQRVPAVDEDPAWVLCETGPGRRAAGYSGHVFWDADVFVLPRWPWIPRPARACTWPTWAASGRPWWPAWPGFGPGGRAECRSPASRRVGGPAPAVPLPGPHGAAGPHP